MKMLTLLVAAALAIVATPIATQRPGPTRIRVFVTSIGAAGGFTDPNKDNQDTMKDLRDSLRHYNKDLALVDVPDEATIVLTVMNREKAQVTAGFLGAPARDCIVRVKFSFKAFETEMSGSAQGGTLTSGGAWSKAAGKVAKQIDQWITANRAKLLEQ